MPPHPLSQVRSDAHVIAGPGSQTFDRRPALTPYIAKIIAEWWYNEANFCTLLTYFLSAEAGPVMAMMQALRSSSAQFDMIEAAASNKLYDPELEAFEAVMKIVRRAASKRNKIAHHLWAYCDELQDAVILVEPSAYHELFVKAATRSNPAGTWLLYPNVRNCLVYREKELQEVLAELEVVSKSITFLANYLMLPTGSSIRNNTYKMLCNAPEISDSLVRDSGTASKESSSAAIPLMTWSGIATLRDRQCSCWLKLRRPRATEAIRRKPQSPAAPWMREDAAEPHPARRLEVIGEPQGGNWNSDRNAVVRDGRREQINAVLNLRFEGLLRYLTLDNRQAKRPRFCLGVELRLAQRRVLFGEWHGAAITPDTEMLVEIGADALVEIGRNVDLRMLQARHGGGEGPLDRLAPDEKPEGVGKFRAGGDNLANPALGELALDEIDELAGTERVQLDAPGAMIIVAQQEIDFRLGCAIPLQGLADLVTKAWVGRTSGHAPRAAVKRTSREVMNSGGKVYH